MLQPTVILALSALAHVASSEFCQRSSPNYLGGYELPSCKLATGAKTKFWEVNLPKPALVKYAALSVRNRENRAPLNFTVTVDGQWCGQIDQYTQVDIFQISCANGGIRGSKIEYTTEHPFPSDFQFCDFDVCGDGAPEINLHGDRADQSSDASSHLGASNAIDGNSRTYSSTAPDKTPQPWWSVNMGAPVTVHYIEVTNRAGLLSDFGNVEVTVDDKPCGPIIRSVARLHEIIECPNRVTGQVVKIQLKDVPVKGGVLSLVNVRVFGEPKPENPHKIDLNRVVATQSSNWGPDYVASKAIDGNPNTFTNTAAWGQVDPWWSVEFGGDITVHYIEITNRAAYLYRLGNVVVTVDEVPCGRLLPNENKLHVRIECPGLPTGKVLKIQLENAPYQGILTLNEVEVFGTRKLVETKPDPVPRINLLGYVATQSSDMNSETDASKALDGNPNSFSNTKKGLTKMPWWTVNMNGPVLVHYIEITNHAGSLNRLGNVVVSVDGKSCGPMLIKGDELHVKIDCPKYPVGQILKIELQEAPDDGILAMAEVKVFGYRLEVQKSKNHPEFKPKPTQINPRPDGKVEVRQINLKGAVAVQSSSVYRGTMANQAIDGNPKTCAITQIGGVTNQPWWTVDMGSLVTVHYIKVINRPYFYYRFKNVVVTVDGQQCAPKLVTGGEIEVVWIHCTEPITGQYLTIQLKDSDDSLNFCELDVFGVKLGQASSPVPKPAQWFEMTDEILKEMVYDMNLKGLVATQSSTVRESNSAYAAIDSNRKTCSLTASSQNPWWSVDLGTDVNFQGLQIYQNSDYPIEENDIVVSMDGIILDDTNCGPRKVFSQGTLWYYCTRKSSTGDNIISVTGKVLRIEQRGYGALSMCGVYMTGSSKSGTALNMDPKKGVWST